MILLNEINQIPVKDYSCMNGELEYVLVENTPGNRKKIDLALATQFNWAIVDLANPWHLTAGGSQVLSEHSEDNAINVAGIVYDELPHELTERIYWSREDGFFLEGEV